MPRSFKQSGAVMVVRCALVGVVVCAGAGWAAVPASAWQAGVDGGVLRVTADPGQANRVDVDIAADGQIVALDEAGAVRALGAGCADPDGEGTATCSRAGLTRLVVETGDLDDTVAVGEIGLPTAVAGGDGNDQLTTASGDDVLDGGAGNDGLDAAGGSDVLSGGAGDDQLAAGIGDDVVDGGEGVDTLDGDVGDDGLVGGAGGDQLDGGAGNDRIDGQDGDDELLGGDGDDALMGAGGQDRAIGDAGADRLDGGAGGDDLDGGEGADASAGGDGDDVLQSTSGGDALDGGPADDQLLGASVLLGGAGADRLSGFEGADVLDGQEGDDTVDGGPGADALAGGGGRDSLSYREALDGVRVSLNGMADDGGPGEADDVAGDLEVLSASESDDVLVAGSAALELHGGGGNDKLVGSPQGELLDGGDGDDVLDGLAGADVLSGGEGTDVVTYEMRWRGVRVALGQAGADGEHGEGDDVGGDVERVIGSQHDDRLSTTLSVPVRLDGGAGDDVIRLAGLQRGDAPPEGSTAGCGTGTDLVRAGRRDVLTADCDIARVAGRLTRLGVQAARSPRLRVDVERVRLGRHGVLRVPVSCARETWARCVMHVRVVRRGEALGSLRTKVGRGRSATLRIMLARDSRQVARVLRRGGAMRISLSVRDQKGRFAHGRASVPVRRAT